LRRGNKKKWIFLSWSYSRRSEDIAALEGIEYFYFPIRQKIRFLQFPLLFIKTVFFLIRRRPKVIFIQHPPIHAIFPVFIYVEKPHHNLYIILHRFYSYFAAVTLFHSKAILERVRKWRCNCMVLENPVRELKLETHFSVKKRPAVGMVSSFSSDEHILDVVKAAGEIRNVSFYITGDKGKAPREILNSASDNIQFTGFIKGKEYYEFLKAMDFIIVLTDREESALLGAYETISAETPLVLSKTNTMTHYFPLGAVFVRNISVEIKEGIEKALKEKGKLVKEIKELKVQKLRRQNENFSKIENLLSSRN
jgi:hypothetical protein